MILHLILFSLIAFGLKYFFAFSFFQVIVVCLLFGIYNMLYTLLEEVGFIDLD